MNFSRRQFVKGGVTAFTFGFAAPQMLCDIALAQGVPSRNLVVVYLSGGNDSLSTVIPYRDPFYASRRPTLAVPAGNVLQIGTDSSNIELGLHPRLTGLKSIFDSGRWRSCSAPVTANQSRSHFTGFDIWGTASATNPTDRMAVRYLDHCQAPDRSLVAWNTQRDTTASAGRRLVGVPRSPTRDLCVSSPTAALKPATSAPRRRASHRTFGRSAAPCSSLHDASRARHARIAWRPSRPTTNR